MPVITSQNGWTKINNLLDPVDKFDALNLKSFYELIYNRIFPCITDNTKKLIESSIKEKFDKYIYDNLTFLIPMFLPVKKFASAYSYGSTIGLDYSTNLAIRGSSTGDGIMIAGESLGFNVEILTDISNNTYPKITYQGTKESKFLIYVTFSGDRSRGSTDQYFKIYLNFNGSIEKINSRVYGKSDNNGNILSFSSTSIQTIIPNDYIVVNLENVVPDSDIDDLITRSFQITIVEI